MPLSPATIDAMLAAGLTAEQMGAIIKAELAAGAAKDAAVDEARKAKAREGNRERQARWRQRNARNADNAVTDRDERDPPPKIYNSTPHHDSPADPDGSAAPAPKAKLRRKHALPADWQPGERSERVRAELGRPAEWMHRTAAAMRSWAEGKGEVRADWDATHDGWMRREADREAERPAARAGPGRARSSNGFFDLIRDDMAGPDDRRADPQRQPLRIASGGRQ